MNPKRWNTPIQADGKSTPEYNSWRSMIYRCHNPRSSSWDRYGGRGIEVCERWHYDFDAFYEDMGPRPDGTSLDRIDVNGHYEPENCRWASKQKQANNRTNNVRVTLGGMDMTLSEAGRMLGFRNNKQGTNVLVSLFYQVNHLPAKNKMKFITFLTENLTLPGVERVVPGFKFLQGSEFDGCDTDHATL